jgi:uncharacterized protein YwgA
MLLVREKSEDLRTPADKALDSILLLYILQRSNPCLGRLKVQKATFLVEHELGLRKMVGPHFKFFRYLKGPFSKNLWDDFDDLAELGLVDDVGFDLTERGHFVANLIVSLLREVPENRDAFDVIDSTLGWCQSRTGTMLMQHVYCLDIVPQGAAPTRMTIKDIPLFVDLITPAPGGLKVPDKIQNLINEELSVTPEEIEAERVRLPQTREETSLALLEAMLDPRGS